MDHASLVDQVKAIQRSDPTAKASWWEYCDTHLGSVKDPSRHGEDVLQDFLSSYHSGSLPPPSAIPEPKGKGKGKGKGDQSAMMNNMMSMMGMMGKGCGGMGGMGGKGAAFKGSGGGVTNGGAADLIKAGQRASGSFKEAWRSYCNANGSGTFDPSTYDEQYIGSFFEYTGTLVLGELGGDMGGMGGGMKRGAPADAWGAPMKRPNMGKGAMAWGGGGGGGDESDPVSRVKLLQRSDPAGREAWQAFVDVNCGGVKDPTRHDPSVLLQFLTSYGA
jgi:hypothetical protein